jgi:ankyrin repeat protein
MSVDPKTQILFEAIATVNYDLVKRAVDAGASLNSTNDSGQTPLAVACRQGNVEIVDLLIAAGAQMHVRQEVGSPSQPQTSSERRNPVLPMSQDPQSSEDRRRLVAESSTSPTGDRQISFENLIDLIECPPNSNNATEIEQLIPIDLESDRSPTGNRQISFENLIDLIESPPSSNNATEIEQFTPLAEDFTTPIRNRQTPQAPADNWGEVATSSDEATYTFDLDAVFATTEANNANILPDAPEMFVDSELTMTSLRRPVRDVGIESGETYAFDLSPDLARLGIEPAEEPDCLDVPMGAWSETETYMLDSFAGLESEVEDTATADSDDLDRLFVLDEDSAEGDLEEGETYIVDLDGFDLAQSQPQPDALEDGETYAVDLEDLSQPRSTQIETSAANLLEGDLQSNLFPPADDEPDFDPDTQTTTDIFGHSGTKQDDDRGAAYDEHATNTSLMAAAIDGDLDLVQQAIEAGANLDRFDWNLSYSPLGMAIDRGHADIVQCLLTAGANPHCGSTLTTALGLAAERGEVEILQMLLPRGVDVNTPVSRDGWTALLSAIKNGHRSVVQLLVTAGANVNVWSQGETPILLAAKCEERDIYNYLYPLVNTAIRLCADRDGEYLLQSNSKRRIREQNRPIEKFIEMATVGNLEEIERAIEVGIEVDEIGAKGHTALMAAAYYGHKGVVNRLLKVGADPNLLSDGDGLVTAGMTALMLVAGSFFASNRHQIAQVLLANGADIDRRGAGGRTAIFYAALAGSGYTEFVETAIAAGADLDIQDDLGHTLLSSVAAAENYPMFNLLMQAGASMVGLESVQLIQAASTGNVDRVKSLLSSKVNIDLDRGAAIGKAAAAGHTEVVALLIKAGANVNLRDKLGFTPIASAAYAGYGEIVRLLVDAGADIQAPADSAQSYSALEYAQMGLYQFQREDLQHAQIVQLLQQLSTPAV